MGPDEHASGPARGPASQRAYDFAKWAILSGVYPAGSVITEAGLAHEIGLSRTPSTRRWSGSRSRGW